MITVLVQLTNPGDVREYRSQIQLSNLFWEYKPVLKCYQWMYQKSRRVNFFARLCQASYPGQIILSVIINIEPSNPELPKPLEENTAIVCSSKNFSYSAKTHHCAKLNQVPSFHPHGRWIYHRFLSRFECPFPKFLCPCLAHSSHEIHICVRQTIMYTPKTIVLVTSHLHKLCVPKMRKNPAIFVSFLFRVNQ